MSNQKMSNIMIQRSNNIEKYLFLISDAIVRKALSTLVASLAEVSKNGISS
jgi:hypothetical protein